MLIALDTPTLSRSTPHCATPPLLSPPGDLRTALYSDVDSFVDALHGRDFLGGASPNLADLSMFGVLRAVAGTPAYNDVVVNTKVGSGVVGRERAGRGWAFCGWARARRRMFGTELVAR
jgi:hypothetical protein